MDIKLFLTVFVTIFIAELGDKTQLATMLFAADQDTHKMTVFLGAAGALILSSAVGIAAGLIFTRFLNERVLNYAAGTAFIIIGLWTIIKA